MKIIIFNIIMGYNEKEFLPKYILDKGIVSEGGSIAWNKNNVIDAIEEIVKLNYAILGGDVWALRFKDIPNLNDPIDYYNIYVGIIPFKNGNETVCNWHSDKKSDENWSDYVLKCKKETLEYIFSLSHFLPFPYSLLHR